MSIFKLWPSRIRPKHLAQQQLHTQPPAGPIQFWPIIAPAHLPLFLLLPLCTPSLLSSPVSVSFRLMAVTFRPQPPLSPSVSGATPSGPSVLGHRLLSSCCRRRLSVQPPTQLVPPLIFSSPLRPDDQRRLLLYSSSRAVTVCHQIHLPFPRAVTFSSNNQQQSWLSRAAASASTRFGQPIIQPPLPSTVSRRCHPLLRRHLSQFPSIVAAELYSASVPPPLHPPILLPLLLDGIASDAALPCLQSGHLSAGLFGSADSTTFTPFYFLSQSSECRHPQRQHTKKFPQ